MRRAIWSRTATTAGSVVPLHFNNCPHGHWPNAIASIRRVRIGKSGDERHQRLLPGAFVQCASNRDRCQWRQRAISSSPGGEPIWVQIERHRWARRSPMARPARPPADINCSFVGGASNRLYGLIRGPGRVHASVSGEVVTITLEIEQD
jgi:hypothetical protein